MSSAAPFIITERRTNPGTSYDRKITRQLDELQSLSLEERDRKLGNSAVDEAREFYNLTYNNSNISLSYRPRIMMPELQFLALNEASDLTSESPKVYITSGGNRDEDREKAFQANWSQQGYNNRLFEAVLWSQFLNVGWLEVGYCPWTRNGKGSVWLASREPGSFFPDPGATNDHNWSWVMAEDWMYLDKVKINWPERGSEIRIKSGAYGKPALDEEDAAGSPTFQLPPGPMSEQGPAPDKIRYGQQRVRVRRFYGFDTARESVKELIGTESANKLELVPSNRWKYPNGRFIVECEGIALADGPNYFPRLPEDERGTFPFFGIWSLPPIKGLYGPAPIKFGKDQQALAERLYTGLFENITRLNNGVTYIPSASGIEIDNFGGLPGEVQMVQGGTDNIPKTVWPEAIPQHMTQLPELLLSKVDRFMGFSQARQGQQAAGNISADLNDASIFQSQSITRLKGRFFGEAVKRIAQAVYYSMATYKTEPDWFSLPKEGKSYKWNPVSDPMQHQFYLDEDSIKPMSSAALQKIAMTLAGKGIPTKFLLESFNIPGAAAMAEEGEREMQLAAMARIRKPR